MSTDASLVAYEDDVAVEITARDNEEAQKNLSDGMSLVMRRIGACGLDLALQKTKIVILTRRRVPTIMEIAIGNLVVETKRTDKHFWVTLDTKLLYWGAFTNISTISKAAERASESVAALGRLMDNVNGPCSSKYKLYINII